MSERKGPKAVKMTTPPAVENWVQGEGKGAVRQKAPTKKMTWELPLELYKWLAHRAIDEDRSMLAIVQEALGRYRDEVEKDA